MLAGACTSTRQRLSDCSRSASLDIGPHGPLDVDVGEISALPSQLSTSYGAIFDSTNDSYVVYLDRNNKELRVQVTDVNNHAARPGIPRARSKRISGCMSWPRTRPGRSRIGQACIYLNGQAKDAHNGMQHRANRADRECEAGSDRGHPVARAGRPAITSRTH